MINYDIELSPSPNPKVTNLRTPINYAFRFWLNGCMERDSLIFVSVKVIGGPMRGERHITTAPEII